MITPSNPLEAYRALLESREEENRVQVFKLNRRGEIDVCIEGPGSRFSFNLSPEDAERLIFLLRCALMNQEGGS